VFSSLTVDVPFTLEYEKEKHGNPTPFNILENMV
jgi:hypothetical protein